MDLRQVVETFGEERAQIIWFPPVALGYLHTLSGSDLQFYTALVSIAGSMILWDMQKAIFPDGDARSGESLPPLEAGKGVVPGAAWQRWTAAFALAIWVIAVAMAIIGIEAHYTHSNLILVGITLVGLGSLVTVIFNGYTLLDLESRH